MALPPRRPRTTSQGTPWSPAASASLDSGGADEADRDAEDRRRLRRALLQHFQQPEQGGRRIADGDHGAVEIRPPQLQRRRRAGGAELARRGRGTAGSRSVQITLVVRRQPGAGDAVRHHLGIAQDRRAGVQRGARGAHHAGPEIDGEGGLDQPAGMDHPHRDVGLLRRKAAEIGLFADDGEGALIDGGAVAHIVEWDAPQPPCLSRMRRAAAASSDLRDDELRRVARPAFDHETGPAVQPHYGEVGRARVRAALDAARDMQAAPGQRAAPAPRPARAFRCGRRRRPAGRRQAETERRGSCGSVMKPRAAALRRTMSTLASARPMTSSARPKQVAMPEAPARSASAARPARAAWSVWPKARPRPSARLAIR